jgi:antitoxin MazE
MKLGVAPVPIPIAIRSIGNSKGVLLPKPVLAQVGLEDAVDAELTVENGTIVLRKAARPVRQGWAEAAAQVAKEGPNELVMGDFGNEADADLTW